VSIGLLKLEKDFA
jgi:hypothetical protein